MEKPIPHFDAPYIGRIPRPVLALDHELTSKLIHLDEITGGGDLIRQRRKALAAKVERILSKIDEGKRIFSTMDPPPAPEPVITSHHDSSQDSSQSSTDTELPDAKDADSTTTENKKKESDKEVQVREEQMEDISGAGIPSEGGSQGFVDGMSAMDIQDVSGDSSSNSATPTFTPTVSSIDSVSTRGAAPTKPTATSTSRVPPLKTLCYNLCDSLIKKALL